MRIMKNKLALILVAFLIIGIGFAGYKKVTHYLQRKQAGTYEKREGGQEVHPQTFLSQGIAKTPWPVFQGDERHTGRSFFTGKHNLKRKWIFEVNSIVETSVTIGTDGSLYFGAYDSHFYALDPSGKVRWKFPTRGPIRGTAAIARDGTVYVASRDGALYALSSKGIVKWIRVLSEKQIDSSPVIGNDGTIYVGCHEGFLYAVHADGSLQWVSESLGHISASSPAIERDGTIYIGSYDGNIYALDNTNGRIKWKFKTSGGIRASPAIDDGTIYIGSRDGTLYAVNRDGTLNWSFKTKGDIRATASISKDGKILFGSWDGNFYALSKEGNLLWKYNAGKPIEASASLDGAGNIYFTSLSAQLYILTPDGKLKQKLPTETFIHGTPVIDDDGSVYLTAGTRLLAFGTLLPSLEIDVDKKEFSTQEPINAIIKINNKQGEEVLLNLKIWVEFVESRHRKIIGIKDKLLSMYSEVSSFSISLYPFIEKGDDGLYKLRARLSSPITGEEIDYKETFFYRYKGKAKEREKGAKTPGHTG